MSGIKRFGCTLALVACGCVTVSFAQQAGQRAARSLTSEDLLNRPTLYIPAAVSTSTSTAAPSRASATKTSGGVYYRDPAGAFTLNFPNNNWHINPRASSAGRIYNERSFRRIEDEGFASATANIYVLTANDNLPVTDPSRMSADEQRGLAEALATRFLSSNASLVSVEPVASKAQTGLRIIADQAIARVVVVRASINVFARQGRLYVVVCCASPETFDAASREFDAITSSLASSVMRS
jgi:hypothetical protein